MVDKNGFVKVIEAYIAISLLLGFVFFVIQNNNARTPPENRISESEINVLESIQINNTLRSDVLSVTNFDLSSNDTGFPSSLKPYATINNPNYACYLKVCSSSGICDMNFTNSKQIYSNNILITSSLQDYSIRELKIFCVKND